MALAISQEVEKELSSVLKAKLSKLSNEDQALFEEEYKKNKCKYSMTNMVLTSIFLPGFQFTALKQNGMFFLMIITVGGCGLWAIYEMFNTPARVRKYNEDVASKVLNDIR